MRALQRPAIPNFESFNICIQLFRNEFCTIQNKRRIIEKHNLKVRQKLLLADLVVGILFEFQSNLVWN